MTRTMVWVKNTKVMPQKLHYLSFLLGKGGNPYISRPYVKKKKKKKKKKLK